MKPINTLSIALAAGCIATPALAQSAPTEHPTLHKKLTGHIYFNAITGEKIAAALTDNIRPAVGNEGSEVWIADNNTPCAAFGQTSGTAAVIDAPNGEFGFDTNEGQTFLDWGDIQPDSIVDCIQVDYFGFVQDTDTDGDSIGDGVEGFGATWTFNDGDNGFNSSSTRQGLIALTLFGLPGSFDGTFSGYILTIDLVASFNSSLAFEIGDSDNNLNGAAVHNPLQFISDIDSNGEPDGDLDNDGLADFSYSMQYIQPGTVDFDSDGIPDGDPALKNLTAVGLAAPFGAVTETDNGDGTFSYTLTPDSGTNANGAEDFWDIFDANGVYEQTISMGGFSCNSDGLGDVNAFSQIDMIMYRTGGFKCPGDFNCDGQLDINDILDFLDVFNAAVPGTDFNNDGIFDIDDILDFLDAFNAGCGF